MEAAFGEVWGILERIQAELILVIQKRDGIAIEPSADQMDEIQYASERDLAIQHVDRESALLREVKAALQRVRDGGFGDCAECGSAISPKRLAAVPWAALCLLCQDRADRYGMGQAKSMGERLEWAA
jgi:DnaK suppressor protein